MGFNSGFKGLNVSCDMYGVTYLIAYQEARSLGVIYSI